MTRPGAVFFCGHHSPFGLAHLEPILRATSFRVTTVVLASEACWAAFRERLGGASSGGLQHERGSLRRWWKDTRRRLLRAGRRERPADEIRARVAAAGAKFVVADDVNAPEFVAAMANGGEPLHLCAAYPQILSGALLRTAARGAINFHPSLLPRFRGAHPHFWAIRTGARESGLTAHYMTERVDEGDIVAQVGFPIADLDYAQFYERIRQEVPGLVAKVDRFVGDAGSRATPQDPALASTFRQDREIHHRLFWSQHSADEIRDLARTLVGFCYFGTRRVRLRKVTVVPGNRNMTNGVVAEPGTVVDLTETGPVVAALGGYVVLEGLKVDGCRGYGDWVRRCRVGIGAKFG